MTDKEKLEAFTKLVKLMRNTQKTYFRTRDKEVLATSKIYEKDVDKAVEEILNPIFNNQQELF